MVIDPIAAGAAFVTYWLRGRFGGVSEKEPSAGRRRWQVEPASTGRPAGPPFELQIEPEALARDLGHLREWLEMVAEDAASVAPESPGHYVVSSRHGVTRTVSGSTPQAANPRG